MRSLPALLVLAVLAPPASAAEVRWEDAPGRFGGPYVHVTGTPGEASDLTVAKEASGGVLVSDAGSDLTALAPCRAETPRRVSCPLAGAIHVNLGDGADTLSSTTGVYADLGDGDDVATSATGSIEGGPGNDRLTTDAVGTTLDGGAGDDLLAGRSLHGGSGADTLLGTGGDDQIHGGPGSDRISGGEGDDLLGAGEGTIPPDPPGEPGADHVDGGAGSDAVLYDDALAGVTVDLRNPAPEGDTLRSIENVSGSRHDDRLLGTDGDERLQGTAGRDVIDGRGGDDRISGGEGPDRVIGGDGDDDISAPPGSTVDAGPGNDVLSLFSRRGRGPHAPAAYDCGPGRDVVMAPLWSFAMPGSCERIGLLAGPGLVATTPRPGRRVVSLVCPRTRSCDVEVQWRRGARVVDRRRLSLRLGRRARVRSRASRRATAVRIVVRPHQRGPFAYGLRLQPSSRSDRQSEHVRARNAKGHQDEELLQLRPSRS